MIASSRKILCDIKCEGCLKREVVPTTDAIVLSIRVGAVNVAKLAKSSKTPCKIKIKPDQLDE